jgi:hypothetical protein
MMLKNEKKSWRILFYNNMMMYIKIDLFFNSPLAITNLSYNINC